MNNQIRDLDSKYVVQTYRRTPIVLVRGKGARVFDEDGREYVTILPAGRWIPAPWINVIANPAFGFQVAVETNGTQVPPPGLDWICVSPKAGAGLSLCAGNELKLVFPQAGAEPGQFESLAFEHFFLQPMDGPLLERHTREALAYCLANPRWRLSLQTHKLLGIR